MFHPANHIWGCEKKQDLCSVSRRTTIGQPPEDMSTAAWGSLSTAAEGSSWEAASSGHCQISILCGIGKGRKKW